MVKHSKFIVVCIISACAILGICVCYYLKGSNKSDSDSTNAKQKGQEAKCGDGLLIFPDFVQNATKECAEIVKDKDGIGAVCFDACQFKKQRVLIDENKPEFDLDKFDQVISKFPQAARERISVDGKKCFQNVGPLSHDNNCKSHAQYITCVLQVYAVHCHIGDDIEE